MIKITEQEPRRFDEKRVLTVADTFQHIKRGTIGVRYHFEPTKEHSKTWEHVETVQNGPGGSGKTDDVPTETVLMRLLERRDVEKIVGDDGRTLAEKRIYV